MPLQAGTIYRYFRADADHDISTDPFAFTLDGGITWVTTGVTYIPVGSLPAAPAAVHAANPPQPGFAGYWFRIFTGPSPGVLPLVTGPNRVQAKATDNPEIPFFGWTVIVGPNE